MTPDKPTPSSAEKAAEFTALAVMVNCEYDSPERAELYGMGISFGYKNGWEACNSRVAEAVAKLENVRVDLEVVTKGHTIYERLEDQSGLEECDENAVRCERKILVTPETEAARDALAQLDAAIAMLKEGTT